MSLLSKGDSIQIREVWNDNLEEEFALIQGIVDDFPYIAMDTEFPGIVLRPVGNFKNSNDYHYQTLKDNVDMLKLIQLGLTFSDEHGNLPTCGTEKQCIWQFNFKEFNVNDDVFANDSVELLRESGIDFKKNNEKGIDARRFGELLMSSGIVLNDNVHWVTFHSGYDFGYLLKVLTCKNLPETQAGFFNLISMYFPTIYDIKHLMKFCNSLHGGLNKLAELLEVERIGICHQAGRRIQNLQIGRIFIAGSLFVQSHCTIHGEYVQLPSPWFLWPCSFSAFHVTMAMKMNSGRKQWQMYKRTLLTGRSQNKSSHIRSDKEEDGEENRMLQA